MSARKECFGKVYIHGRGICDNCLDFFECRSASPHVARPPFNCPGRKIARVCVDELRCLVYNECKRFS